MGVTEIVIQIRGAEVKILKGNNLPCNIIKAQAAFWKKPNLYFLVPTFPSNESHLRLRNDRRNDDVAKKMTRGTKLASLI